VHSVLVYDIVRYLGAAIIAGLPHPRSISRYRLIDKNPTTETRVSCHCFCLLRLRDIYADASVVDHVLISDGSWKGRADYVNRVGRKVLATS